jgi:hypothetical protein
VSLLSQPAAGLPGTGAGLPLPEVRRAAQEVDTASRRLAAALAAHPAPVPVLGAALEHLDSAAGALLLAQHAIQGYLAAIGAPSTGAPSTVDEPVRSNWWVERVVQLTKHTPTLRDPAGSAAELLAAALRPAQAGDRAGFAEVLASAEPTIGLGLAGLTAPLIERYAAELADPSPALDTVEDLLPALPDGLAEALLARTPDRPWDNHPADPAIAGTGLVAGLLNLLGRNGLPEHHG